MKYGLQEFTLSRFVTTVATSITRLSRIPTVPCADYPAGCLPDLTALIGSIGGPGVVNDPM